MPWVRITAGWKWWKSVPVEQVCILLLPLLYQFNLCDLWAPEKMKHINIKYSHLLTSYYWEYPCVNCCLPYERWSCWIIENNWATILRHFSHLMPALCVSQMERYVAHGALLKFLCRAEDFREQPFLLCCPYCALIHSNLRLDISARISVSITNVVYDFPSVIFCFEGISSLMSFTSPLHVSKSENFGRCFNHGSSWCRMIPSRRCQKKQSAKVWTRGHWLALLWMRTGISWSS